jgi:hypothetical protein
MFILIVTVALLFQQHLRDHEQEQMDAELFAERLLKRFNEMIDDKLQEPDDD